MSDRSMLETLFAEQIRTAKLPAPEREYVFAPPRKYRFDFAWPHAPAKMRVIVSDPAREDYFLTGEAPLAVEIEGGTYIGGAHNSPHGVSRDIEKGNLALLLGWRVLRGTAKMVNEGVLITQLVELFAS